MYDESPRQNVASDKMDEEGDEDYDMPRSEEEDQDDDEMINVAEKIFIRLADEIKK